MKTKIPILILLCIAEASVASTIDPNNKHAWSPVSGWVDFRPSDQGVSVYADHLEGYAWGESIGWIQLGNYTSGEAHTYANNSNADWGVNHDGAGNLSGYAWTNNTGWINFNASQVSIDMTSGDFNGDVWSESVGWIRLNDPSYKVRTILKATALAINENVSNPVTPDLSNSLGQAIIIAAGGAQKSNTLFTYSNDFTQRMYRILKERGFSDDEIHYMNPQPPDLDNDGYLEDERQDYNFFNPEQEFEEVFAEVSHSLRADQQFILFLHGHARPDYFQITPHYELSAQKLRDLLATLPAGIEQIIILDSCYSGSFFDDLSGVENRVIISSADDSTLAWNTKYASFTDTFLRGLRRAYNLNQAFQAAEEMIINDPSLFRKQRPWLDDNADGEYSFNHDGRHASQIYLGKEGVHAAEPPTIKTVHPPIILAEDETSVSLWVRTTQTVEGINQVRAILINPEFSGMDYDGMETHFGREEMILIYNPAETRYEKRYDYFQTAGMWRVLYQAQDTSGVWSDIMIGEVQAAGTTRAATVRMELNQSRYTSNETLRLDMLVNGQAEVDLYIAIIFPDGNFMTIAYPLNFSRPGAIQVYQPMVEIAGQNTYPIMNFPMPSGIALGEYSACGVVVKAGTAALEQENWIDIDCAVFEIF